jgi:hypothetical protein
MAKTLHTSRTRMANELIERGLSNMLGEAVSIRIQQMHQEEEIEMTQRDLAILRMIKREARRQGLDISKFI